MISARIKLIDLILGFCSIAAAVYIFLESAGFPEPHESQLGAAVFPRLMAAFLVFFGVLINLNNFTMKETDSLTVRSSAQIVLSLAVLVVYGLVFKYLGFLLSSPPFIAALLLILRVRNPLAVTTTSLGSTLVLYGVFKLLLSVPLPDGILGY
jgi:putative tricarboxylic transport membrane protein